MCAATADFPCCRRRGTISVAPTNGMSISTSTTCRWRTCRGHGSNSSPPRRQRPPIACDSARIVWTPAPDGTPLVRDGRETFMRDCVWRAFCTLERRLGRQPTLDELFQAAGANTCRRADLSRAGRGADELRRKCNALLTRNPKHLPERKGLSKPFLAR